MSIIATILAKIFAYLTSLWSVARMVFDHLPVQVMEDCFGLLCVIFLIYIIDNLPISRRKKKDEAEDDDYILVKRA